MADQQTQERPRGEQPTVCWDGCGGTTKGGDFLPGHDAKLHSRAKRAARGELDLAEEIARLPHDDAKAYFLQHHDAEKARVEAKASARAGSPSPKPADESGAAPGGQEPVRHESASQTGLQPALVRDFPGGETLCIGIDFAWWGGGTSPRSQTDTLVFAQVNGEQAGPLKPKRVDLSATYNPHAAYTEPNCDPDAGLVLKAVQDVLVSRAGTGRVVLAVDAPLVAVDRPHLSARSRQADRQTAGGPMPGRALEFRQCEKVARRGPALDRGHRSWRHVWNV